MSTTMDEAAMLASINDTWKEPEAQVPLKHKPYHGRTGTTQLTFPQYRMICENGGANSADHAVLGER